jgi:hypothetical protein
MATAEPSRGIGASSRIAQIPFRSLAALPASRLAALAAIAVAGVAAAATTLALGLTNDEVDHVAIRVFLNDWITLNFIGAGLIAWWRRPDSRFGPLMVAAGFVNFLATLDWASAAVPYTIGVALDLLAPVLFLHVFLAYPSGRLSGRLERTVVAGAYAAAVGVGLVRMMLGGAGPGNLIQIVSRPRAVEAVQDVQLIGISAFCLAGIGVLAARRWGAHRPPRRPLGLLVDSFALGLLMIAALFVCIVFVGGPDEVPAIEAVRRTTFFVVGLAPIVFLFGLLRSRLAVGPAIVSLGAEAARGNVVDALKTALRDPSLDLGPRVAQTFGGRGAYLAEPLAVGVEGRPEPNAPRCGVVELDSGGSEDDGDDRVDLSTAALNRQSASSSEAISSSEGAASGVTAASPSARSLRRRSRRSSRAQALAEMRTQSIQKLLRSLGASWISVVSWSIACSRRATAESCSLTRLLRYQDPALRGTDDPARLRRLPLEPLRLQRAIARRSRDSPARAAFAVLRRCPCAKSEIFVPGPCRREHKRADAKPGLAEESIGMYETTEHAVDLHSWYENTQDGVAADAAPSRDLLGRPCRSRPEVAVHGAATALR